MVQWLLAGFVPTHSGGSVPDSHRLPYLSLLLATERLLSFSHFHIAYTLSHCQFY
jgi:hypothetical protein